MALKQEYKEYRVLDLPSSGLQAGDRYYLNVGGGKYKTYIVSDGLQLTQEAGNEFIECDTVDDLRNLDARQIWAIQNGYYKGVILNGYYAKGDTPAPIDYYLSDTVESDDGGSVFEVGGIKLKHEFSDKDYTLEYYGKKVYSFDGYENIADFNSSESKLVRASNGDIFIFYRKCEIGHHNHNSGHICYKKSNDEGLTWGEEVVVIDPEFDTRNFVAGSCGNVLSIIYRLYDVGETSTSMGCWSIYSTDNGVNWSSPVSVDPEGTKSVLPFGKIIQRGEDWYFLMYAQSNPNSQCHLYKSSDGLTWSVDKEVYNLPEGFRIAEPVLEDLGEHGSMIIARVSEGSNYNSSFVQIYSNDGVNFNPPQETNLSPGFLAQCPAWIDYIGGDEILVYTNRRPYQVASLNLEEKLYIYSSKISEVILDPMAYKLSHEIPRVYPCRFSTYGYPATLKTEYGWLGTITERRGVDDTVKTMASRYANEADNVYVFKMLEKSYSKTYNTWGENSYKNKFTGKNDFIRKDSDIRQQENFSDHIWKTNVRDPRNAGIVNSNGKMVLLQSFNNPENSNWPQDAQGGIVILAQSASDQGVSWMIGRGNSNSNIGSLFCATMHSGTREWSSWRRLLTDSDVQSFIPQTPSQSGWASINKSIVSFNSASGGSPESGVNYHGFYIPQANDLSNGTRIMMRANRIFIQSYEGGEDMSAIEIITENHTATVSKKGIVGMAEASPDSAEVSAGATPTKEEFDSLLTELRDLKTKLRAAGILAT